MSRRADDPKATVKRRVTTSSQMTRTIVGNDGKEQTTTTEEMEKQREAFSLKTPEPMNVSFVVFGNLIHVEGVKSVEAKSTPDGLRIKTDSGNVNIKCTATGGYFISKDDSGTAQARVMTADEFEQYKKEAEEKEKAKKK